MRILRPLTLAAALCLAFGAALTLATAVLAAEYPAPREGQWTARDFRFHTGEVMPEMRLAYRTVGDPSGEPVLLLHGTAGSSASMLTPAFGGELFGAGQALDASRYFIILPDALGAGKSAKPSDGLRTKFPKYNYDDMVDAQGRYAHMDLGREASQIHGRSCTHGLPAHRDV
jgi:homoserine O-acetyltransferase